jgi:hypothetical protein
MAPSWMQSNLGCLIVGQSSAVLPSQFAHDDEGLRLAKHWRTIALSHMVQVSNLEEGVNGRNPRRWQSP